MLNKERISAREILQSELGFFGFGMIILYFLGYPVDVRPLWYYSLILLLVIIILSVIYGFIIIGRRSSVKKTILLAALVTAVVTLSLTIMLAPESEQENITQLINNEAQWTMQEDIDKIMTIFTNNAYVADAHGETWNGSEHIRERYHEIFTNLSFIRLQHLAIKVAIKGDSALVTCSTEGSYIDQYGIERPIIGGPDSERWIFKRVNGCWKVIAFVYNLS